MKEILQRVHELVRTRTGKSSKQYKDYNDSTSTESGYKVGDKVWLHQPFVKRGLSTKLARPWHGSYTIVKKLSDVVFRIQKVGWGRKKMVVHFIRLRPCQLPGKENDETTSTEATPETAKSDVKKTYWKKKINRTLLPARIHCMHKKLTQGTINPGPSFLPESPPGATTETISCDEPEDFEMSHNHVPEEAEVEAGEDLRRLRREREPQCGCRTIEKT